MEDAPRRRVAFVDPGGGPADLLGAPDDSAKNPRRLWPLRHGPNDHELPLNETPRPDDPRSGVQTR